MKKLLTLAALIFVTVAASAQITWSVKGGVGIANNIGDDVDMDSKIVGRIGVGIEKPLTANWSLMPSLEFAVKGSKYSEEDYTFEYEENVSLYYLQLPILAAYRLNLNDSWNMTIKAGPYFAYGMFGNISTSGNMNSEEVDAFKVAERFDYGIDLGVDFEYHRYVFGLEYEYGLATLIKNTDVKNSAFFVTAGYKF